MIAEDLPAAFGSLPPAWSAALPGWKMAKCSNVIRQVREVSGDRPIAPEDPFRALRFGAPEDARVVLLGQGTLPARGQEHPVDFARDVRPILTLGHERTASAREVPTVGEAGFPELAPLGLELWLMGPPGVPTERLQVLENALTRIVSDPEFRSWAVSAKIDIAPLSSKQTQKAAIDLLSLFEQYKPEIEKHLKK